VRLPPRPAGLAGHLRGDRDKGFVILGIALNIAGEAVVREFIRPAAAGDMPQAIQDIMGWDAELAKRAGVPTYPCLIDCDHVVAELYGVVNVPTAVWIDEAGRIVRPPEPAGVSDGFRTMNTTTFEMPAEAAADNKRRRRIYVDALATGSRRARRASMRSCPKRSGGGWRARHGARLSRMPTSGSARIFTGPGSRTPPGHTSKRRSASAQRAGASAGRQSYSPIRRSSARSRLRRSSGRP
jgi:hypothetical protein